MSHRLSRSVYRTSLLVLLAAFLVVPAGAELVGHRVTSTDAVAAVADQLWLQRLDNGTTRLTATWRDGASSARSSPCAA